jgi:hypothetical protein
MEWYSESKLETLTNYRSAQEQNQETQEETCPICYDSFEDDQPVFECHTHHKYHHDCLENFVNTKLNQLQWNHLHSYPLFRCPLSNITYLCEELANISQFITLSPDKDFIRFDNPNSVTDSMTFRVHENQLNGLYKKTFQTHGDVLHFYFTDPLHRERMIKVETHRQEKVLNITTFFGPRNQEKKVSVTFFKNDELYKKATYQGMKNNERLVSLEYFTVTHPKTIFYEGPKGSEKRVRIEFVTATHYFDGPRGFERLVRAEIKDAQKPLQVQYFQGIKNHEHLVRLFIASIPETCFFEGPKKAERKVRCEYEDRIEYYEGEALNEQVVRTERRQEGE